MEGPTLLFRRGLRRLLGLGGGDLRLDFQAGRISMGREALSLADLRFLEFERGFLTLGTGRSWITADFARFSDGAGPLLTGGALSPSAVRLLSDLKEAVQRNAAPEHPSVLSRSDGGGRPQDDRPFELRYRTRFDILGISLTIAGLAIFMLDLYQTDHDFGERLISVPWLTLVLGLGFLSTAAFLLHRRRARLRLDEEGITASGLLGTRLHRWSALREWHRQYAEVEILGEGIRLPLSLSLLTAGKSPLLLRRSRTTFLSPPARLLLAWLREKAPERVDPPLEISPAERRATRLWVGAVIALNAALYFAEGSPTGPGFRDRLADMGARTAAWPREPWRLLTSLFLHGSPSHLVSNMLVLAVLAPWMGRIFGWARTWSIYLASGVLGNVFAEAFQGTGDHIALGSSTAIFGLLGALLGATHRFPERVPLVARLRFRWAIPLTLLLTLALGKVIQVLDNGAHLGGFLAGLALVWLIPPSRTARAAA